MESVRVDEHSGLAVEKVTNGSAHEHESHKGARRD
jgi:hypothetical protein